MEDDLPGWAGRQLLAEALRAAGLPVVAGAMWRQPADVLTLGERLEAVDLSGRVLAEARRRLPAGVSGAALAGEFRAMAWRCVVAGMALLDVDDRARLTGQRGGDSEAAAPAEPAAQRRVTQAPAVLKAPRKSALPIRLKWEGRRSG
jgi:hypothetical protein